MSFCIENYFCEGEQVRQSTQNVQKLQCFGLLTISSPTFLLCHQGSDETIIITSQLSILLLGKGGI